MVEMEVIAPKVEDFEIDLEKGTNFNVENPSKTTVSGVKTQVNELFSKICGFFIELTTEGRNSNGNSTKEVKIEEGNSKVDVTVVKKVVNEKRKNTSNKKSPKPPRPPRGPSLDPADQKLINEITEIAMLKRAQLERMKNLKKFKGAKPSSSSSSISNVFAMVFTVLFFLMILLQGMSSSRVTSVSVRGSASAETPESGLISVQYSYVKSVAGFDSLENVLDKAKFL